jgi:hypothetical protein
MGPIELVQFLFILAVPIVLAAGAVISLFAAGAIFDALDNPDQLKERIQGLFRRPPRDPERADAGHYYRPYWLR